MDDPMVRYLPLLACACSSATDPVALIAPPPWTMTILQHAATVPGMPYRSAEGPATCWIDGQLVVVTGWELSSDITITTTTSPYVTTVVDHNQGVEGVACADVDGDGTPDVLSASMRSYRHVRISWGPDYDPAQATQIAAADLIGSWKWITAGDVDGDGINEVIASGRNEQGDLNAGRLMWFGSPTPHDGGSWTAHHVAFVGDTYQLDARDLNFDGRLDIFLSDKLGAHNSGLYNGVYWYEGDGLGGFVGHLMFDPPNGTPFGADLGDFDGDGSTELVVAWRSSATGSWFQLFDQTSPGVWTAGSNFMPLDPGLGEVHGVNACDLGLGRPVVAASFVRGAEGQSWVLWLDPVTGEAHDVSGPAVDLGGPDPGRYRKTDQLRCVRGSIFATEGGDSYLLDDYGVLRWDPP